MKKNSFPSLADWACYAYHNKHSYDVRHDGILYSINPLFDERNKLRGYSLTCFAYPNSSGHSSILNGEVTPFIGHAPHYFRANEAHKAARLAHAKRPKA